MYRHNIKESQVCQDWANKTERCNKMKCKYRHPPRTSEKDKEQGKNMLINSSF